MEPQAPPLTRLNSALLLIDFQRDFCEQGGYADLLGGLLWLGDVITRARQLLEAARRAGIFVVHTREGYAPDLSDCPLQRRLRSAGAGAAIGSQGPLGRLLIRGEPGHAIVSALAPLPSEIVIDKASYGAFHRTELEQLLRERGIEHLYFAGLTADVCVHTTLREATDRGFFCHYVQDAIATFDAEIARACERMIEVEGGIWGRLVLSADAARQFAASS